MEFDDCRKILEIDRTEVIENILIYKDGRMTLEKCHWDIPDWTKEEKKQRIKGIKLDVDNPNYVVIGAFYNDLLVGYIRMNPVSPKNRERVYELGQIVVSNGYRRRGIATRLMDLAKRRVVEAGEDTICMLCTPAESTVRFYLSIGFEPFDVPDDEIWSWWDGEDIYMEMKL